MKSESISNLQKLIKDTQDNLNEVLQSCNNYPKVIIIGNPGAGKSTLTNSLTNRELTISISEVGEIRLDGTGVLDGTKSVTRNPNISVDTRNELLFCDCPGFADTEGFNQEIINAFAIDYLISSSNNSDENKIKILLIVSVPEIHSIRGREFFKTFNILNRMIPNFKTMKGGVGLVFTKGKQNHNGLQYLNHLSKNAPCELKEICDYFILNDLLII